MFVAAYTYFDSNNSGAYIIGVYLSKELAIKYILDFYGCDHDEGDNENIRDHLIKDNYYADDCVYISISEEVLISE